ncbi:hypothetical protein BC826DRAFT_419624 [Russula brevipes]|nr:hypothetical protein BC826DRAFT_419624 [Russula brevipes]
MSINVHSSGSQITRRAVASGTAIDGGEGCVVVAVVVGPAGYLSSASESRGEGTRGIKSDRGVGMKPMKTAVSLAAAHRSRNPLGGFKLLAKGYSFSRLLRVFVSHGLSDSDSLRPMSNKSPFFHRHQYIRLQPPPPPPMTMPAVRRIWNWRVAAVEARYASYRGFLRQGLGDCSPSAFGVRSLEFRTP